MLELPALGEMDIFNVHGNNGRSLNNCYYLRPLERIENIFRFNSHIRTKTSKLTEIFFYYDSRMFSGL